MKTEHKTQDIVVDGVSLTVTQTGSSVSISKVVARDRERKLDVTSAVNFADDGAITMVRKLRQAAGLATAPCTCDYRYGFSDHAQHCRSIYVAEYDGGYTDDD